MIAVFIVVATGSSRRASCSRYYVVLPAAITFLTNFDDTLYNVQIRASYYLSFTSLVLVACGLAFEMPIFMLALVRHPRADATTSCAATGGSATSLMVVFAILLPDRRPGLARCSRRSRCSILFEVSIWLSRPDGATLDWAAPLGDEDAAEPATLVSVLSADWVVPVEGAPIETAPSRSATTGRSPRSEPPPTSAAASTSRAA